MTTENNDETTNTFDANSPEAQAWLAEQIAPLNERLTAETKKNNDFLAEIKTLKAGTKTQSKDITDVEALRAHYEGELEQHNSKYAALVDGLVKKEVALSITNAVSEAKGNSTVLAPHLVGRIQGEYTDDGINITVLDDSGNPMFVKGKPATVADLVNSFKSNPTYAVLFEGTGTSGSGASTSVRTINAAGDNPYKATPSSPYGNRSKQLQMEKDNPEMAARLKASAMR